MVILHTDIHKKERLPYLSQNFQPGNQNLKTLQPVFYFQYLSISNMAANVLFMTAQGYSCSS